ncbi:hypothetical protein NP493_6g06043 [Ridgeia piscesae]|uniref:Uncharacterized protein n=1 Tax=Ridgeia piscesae TaxID=27915 RepID=A0AAD9PG42_RIDPI|nr:hypothetical protein NP493_6g06043 [Ridgeia piscesae]
MYTKQFLPYTTTQHFHTNTQHGRSSAKASHQYYDADRSYLYYAHETSQLCLRLILSRYILQVLDVAPGARTSHVLRLRALLLRARFDWQRLTASRVRPRGL